MLEIQVKIKFEHSLKGHWQPFAKLRSRRCTHAHIMLQNVLEMHLHFHMVVLKTRTSAGLLICCD